MVGCMCPTCSVRPLLLAFMTNLLVDALLHDTVVWDGVSQVLTAVGKRLVLVLTTLALCLCRLERLTTLVLWEARGPHLTLLPSLVTPLVTR